MKENLIDQALKVLALIREETEKAREINKQLTEFDGGDFSPQISAMTTKMESEVVALIDCILEPQSNYPIGSYWLYETNAMKDGGFIQIEENKYRIKTIEDVKKYIMQAVYEK